jgi:uncharacterized membrane protein
VGLCPGCRLARRIDAANAGRESLTGRVGPSNPPPKAPPPPPPNPPPWTAASAPAPRPTTALAEVSPETRALVALGYPFWPLAALALLDSKRSPAVRRHAVQAIALNFGLTGLWFALYVIVHVPVLGWSAWPLIPLLAPIWVVAVVVYAFKVWHGDDVRVPLVSDWLDEHESGTVTA